MNVSIIFEDEYFLVIDKPAGLVVNRADTTAKVETLQDWVEQEFREKIEEIRNKGAADRETGEFISRSGIVHRLDKDTSGLLVIAKTPEAFGNLKNQFKSREVVKKYLALMHGRVEPPEGEINAPIGRNPFNRKHFGVFAGGREAATSYKLIKLIELTKLIGSARKEWLSLLELTPHTGRTHQIRVHLKYISHPIVSDLIYGGRKNYRMDVKWCPRLFLHATDLRLSHPKTGESMEFNSPLPSDLSEVFELLK